MLLACDNFSVEITHNYKDNNKNKTLLFLNGLDYLYVEFFVFMIALALNFFMLINLYGDDVVNGSAIYQAYINFIEYIIVIISGIFICLWLCTKWQFHYAVQKQIYLDYLKSKEKKDVTVEDIENNLTCIQKLEISLNLSLFQKNEINGLIILFVCGFVGLFVLNKQYNFFYALQLIIVMNLGENLKNIRISITIRWNQLLSTFLFMLLIMYLYAAIDYYYYYNPSMFRNGPDIIDQCNTIASCFLSVIIYGLRSHGGFGDMLEKPQFLKDRLTYYGRFFHDLVFFIVIIVFLLNIIFGIIIVSFRDLRINTSKKEYDIQNICFICGDSKEELEKQNISFREHTDQVHSIWNYMYYIILVKNSDPTDLNSVNSYVYENIQKKSIGWIPTKDFNAKKDDEEENGEEEEEDGRKETKQQLTTNEL